MRGRSAVFYLLCLVENDMLPIDALEHFDVDPDLIVRCDDDASLLSHKSVNH